MKAQPRAILVVVDFGGSALRGTLITNGQFGESLVFPRVDGKELATAKHIIDTVISHASERPHGLAIAVPGVVDTGSCAMRRAHGKYSSLEGVNLVEWGRTQWGLPTIVENDARAALIGETSTGVAAGSRNAVAVILGTGIGTAALVDGQLIRGHSGHGGILGGHITVEIGGQSCSCGNRGCAETLASTWALGDKTFGGENRGLRGLLDGVREGNGAALSVFDKHVQVWGATVVSLCHLFDPEVVVLTGAPLRQADLIIPPVTQYVSSHLWSSLAAPRIVIPDDPERSVLRGLEYLGRLVATVAPG